jgi:hypothetical protein
MEPKVTIGPGEHNTPPVPITIPATQLVINEADVGLNHFRIQGLAPFYPPSGPKLIPTVQAAIKFLARHAHSRKARRVISSQHFWVRLGRQPIDNCFCAWRGGYTQIWLYQANPVHFVLIFSFFLRGYRTCRRQLHSGAPSRARPFRKMIPLPSKSCSLVPSAHPTSSQDLDSKNHRSQLWPFPSDIFPVMTEERRQTWEMLADMEDNFVAWDDSISLPDDMLQTGWDESTLGLRPCLPETYPRVSSTTAAISATTGTRLYTNHRWAYNDPPAICRKVSLWSGWCI